MSVLNKHRYDVIVIGGGHAGCEAALASARVGLTTAMVTLRPDKIAEMSCNPSIGGVGKGQLVKEIDALGGEMGKNADYTGIQFRRLNTRKGSAVRSSRCQSDKDLYASRMQERVLKEPNLEVVRAEAKLFHVEQWKNGRKIAGIEVELPAGGRETLQSNHVIVTTGTFMRGVMHCGSQETAGGRAEEEASYGLSASLAELNFELIRLKTGTPPRLSAKSLDFSRMKIQPGDESPRRFSFSDTEIRLPQVCCHLTFTNEATHESIRSSLHLSPLYGGKIKGVGPRYCPSIEDKVVKFPDKPRHQVFVEPLGLDTDWIYPNGISTSLPAEVQEKFVRSIPGCEESQFLRYGYAVEYDCIDPRQLNFSLESKSISGLYFAGQVNGTSGYEEAAAQGLIAGISASLSARGKEPVRFSRADSYIGVMIDDLTTMGVTEPYRMFTSRAEFRLSLREDNADLRLRKLGKEVGLVTDEVFLEFQRRKREIEDLKRVSRETFVRPARDLNLTLKNLQTGELREPERLSQLIKRPQLSLEEAFRFAERSAELNRSPDILETVELDIKYEGYIAIQNEEIAKLRRMERTEIPNDFNYTKVNGLSFEAREKLTQFKPDTLADAAKISGITPAALTALLFSIRHENSVAKLKAEP